ncbi:hypothetical protein ACFYO1_31690 [Nocardia sp. NPDC006044]|uniref:hypothetical protein n=1 Tax=Nocardia sp. NPDC006044 TaxID=3364306 RepID=UPI00368D8221
MLTLDSRGDEVDRGSLLLPSILLPGLPHHPRKPDDRYVRRMEIGMEQLPAQSHSRLVA